MKLVALVTPPAHKQEAPRSQRERSKELLEIRSPEPVPIMSWGTNKRLVIPKGEILGASILNADHFQALRSSKTDLREENTSTLHTLICLVKPAR